jgi:hypothetical protein
VVVVTEREPGGDAEVLEEVADDEGDHEEGQQPTHAVSTDPVEESERDGQQEYGEP